MNQDSSASVFWSLLCMRPAGSYLGHPNTWKTPTRRRRRTDRCMRSRLSSSSHLTNIKGWTIREQDLSWMGLTCDRCSVDVHHRVGSHAECCCEYWYLVWRDRATPKSQGPVVQTTVAQQVCGVEPLNIYK